MAKKFRGNCDGSFLMKSEAETKLYWYKLWLRPGMESQIGKPFVIKAYRPADMKSFQRTFDQTGKTWWKEIGGYLQAECLHDPSLMTDVSELEVVNE